MNNKKIYQILNNIKTDIDLYNKVNFNDIEIKKYKKNFKRNFNNKRYYQKIASVCACFIIIGIISAVFPFNKQVYAMVKVLSYKISYFLEIDKDLDDYVTVIGQSQEYNDISVLLNEVCIDKDEFIVSSTLKSDNMLIENYANLDYNVFINGKNLVTGTSGGGKKVDDNIFEEVMNFGIYNIDLNNKLDIEIQIPKVYIDEKEFKGNWNFKFQADGKELSKNTKKLTLDTKIILPDKSCIYLNEYTSNDIGQKIYFNFDMDRLNYDIRLEGKDNLGNPVAFYLSRINNKKGRFNLETIDNGNLNDNITSITLTPYAVKFPEKSGRMNNDFTKIGESFTINLSF